MTEPTKLSAYGEIESVDERFQDGPSTKNPDTGETVQGPKQSLGWFIRLGGSSAVHVGMDKPPAAFVKGARVKHSIELAPEAPTIEAERIVTPTPSLPAAAVESAMAGAGAPDFVKTANDKADAYRR